MGKDFMNQLNKDTQAFDGIPISQTQDEHENAKKQPEVEGHSAVEERKRISLYIPVSLSDKLDEYVNVQPKSRNAIIIELLQNFLTDERMEKVSAAHEAMK